MALSKKAALTMTGAGAVLAIGLAVPAVAFAEDATPTPSASASASASPGAGQPGAGQPGKGTDTGREQKRTEHRDALAEGLAKELGIDKDKVTAALEKVESSMAATAKTERQERLKARLDQAVKDGKLTQEQADAVLKASESGVLPGGMGGGRGGHRGMGGIPR